MSRGQRQPPGNLGPLLVRVLLPTAVLVLSVPWFFVGEPRMILGIPAWAFYGIVGTVVYATTVAVCLGLFWGGDGGRGGSSEDGDNG